MAKHPNLIDMEGQRIGRWSVGGQAGNAPKGGALWLCTCQCGAVAAVLGADLRAGKSLSCGCAGSRSRIGELRRSHGDSGTRLHTIWRGMHQRCRNRSDPYYGGRGVRVCPEWQEYRPFKDWAKHSGYRPGLSIERLDVDGNYEPTNCVWTNAQAQSENRRFVAKAPSGRLWWHIAQDNGISQAAYRSRLYDGWDHHQAATWPMGKKRRDGNLARATYLTLFGETLPASHAARKLGYTPSALYQRAKRKGVTLQQALDQMGPPKPR